MITFRASRKYELMAATLKLYSRDNTCTTSCKVLLIIDETRGESNQSRHFNYAHLSMGFAFLLHA